MLEWLAIFYLPCNSKRAQDQRAVNEVFGFKKHGADCQKIISQT
jgi:hypothetical protein